MILFLSVFSVSCSVIGCWWLGWGHVPQERRLPIGFLSAHVTAATVHVLSRVSPITLALSPSLTLFSCCMILTFSWSFYLLLFFLSPYLFYASLLCSTTLCLFPLFSYCLTCQSFLCFTANCPQTSSLSTSRPHFHHLTWLWTSSHALRVFPHHHLSQGKDSIVCLCWHLITDVARPSRVHFTLTFHSCQGLCLSLLMIPTFFFFSKNKLRRDILSLVSLQMLSMQRARVLMISFGQT